MFLALTLSACAGPDKESPPRPVGSTAAPTSTSAVETLPAEEATEATPSPTPRALYFDGTGRFFAPARSRLPGVEKGPDGGFNLNFTETDIRTVIGAVVGDILGRPYVIDPSVQGTLSLQTSSEIGREGLFSVFETVLRVKGYAMVDVAGVIQIVPVSEAPRRITAKALPIPESLGRPGFGIQIVPLRFTTPSQMRQLLEPFAPQGGILRVDDGRNLLIIAGTRAELAGMIETIETFDVDWMAGMSFALYNVKYVEAETLAKELLNIFGDPASPIAGLVRLVPIPRLNTILAISPQRQYLGQVEEWIARLDIGGATPGRKIYVYPVMNGRAADLASALGQILGGDTAATTTAPPQEAAATPQQNITPSQPSGMVQERGVTTPAVPSVRERQEVSAIDAGGLRIVPNQENNSILILATPSEFGVIEAALKQMDMPPRQVLIEASLAEVTLNKDLRYGVQWMFEPGDNTLTLSQSAGGAVASEFPGFSYVFTGANNARVVLNALESITDVNVLFSPKLMVLNNQSAVLQVGDQVPIPVQSSVSTLDPNAPIVNTIQFRDTGVILTVTPRINEGGLVLVDIEQEVSDVVRTTSSGIDAPTIQQRKITSTVAVQSGDTIALGGLIRENTSDGKSGVPVLSRIPVLGALFGTNTRTLRRTELIVLLTPRIVRDVRKTGEIMDYLRDQFQALPPIERAGDAATPQ